MGVDRCRAFPRGVLQGTDSASYAPSPPDPHAGCGRRGAEHPRDFVLGGRIIRKVDARVDFVATVGR